MTIQENVEKPLEKVIFNYIGDGRNNMANSLLITGSIMGMDVRIISPESLLPEENLIKEAKQVAKVSGARITTTADINFGLKDADVIYTDVWVSMGEEKYFAERIKLLKDYQLNIEKIKNTGNPKVIFMHCLPAIHDTNTEIGKMVFKEYGLKEMEVTDEVFRSKHSVVFDEAENRLHTIKAVW
jgi:ornithine carbamoyltransferase